MRIFLAGVIQGSKKGRGVVAQDYRRPMKAALAQAFPGAEVFDPVEHHPKSVHYPDRKGRAVFRHLMREAARYDALVAFLPEASMGTAIEIWEARCAGRFVAAVTPMDRNWVIRYLCDRVYPDLAAFSRACRDGTLRAAVLRRARKRSAPKCR